MPNAHECIKTVTTEAVQVSEAGTQGQGKPDSPSSTVCDLAEANAFCEYHGKPHVPVSAAFGAERLHVCRLQGSWDLDRAVAENSNALFRSIRKLPSKDTAAEWDDLTFQFGPRSFLYADKDRIVGFASTPKEAERLVTKFGKTCLKPPDPSGGTFYLIEQRRYDIGCQTVTLPPATILSAEAFNLHYGSSSGEWHQQFVVKLHERNHGLSIFEGRPGTGKTFYLRHLMGVLKESHRFYFIPTSTMGVLSKPEFIGFWADQRRIHDTRKFVVILEDSDGALMTRGSDNREQVSAILNLSDGMLADFLRLQIICTINCSAADIDPALLRPGRLLCHRVFPRLDYAHAVRLAENLGRKLPAARDYSLAEVFAGHDADRIDRPRIGFAA
ncbi:MAG TPA: AAA family ATPase [Candidatus Saccharimonadales bacterium]|nr:AAA family ATPase [Candidatus Saccharimonadales bacterium]